MVVWLLGGKDPDNKLNVPEKLQVLYSPSSKFEKHNCISTNTNTMKIYVAGAALGHHQLGFQKEIWVVCPNDKAYARTNVFFQHPFIRHFNSWEVCCKALYDY
jgi:hypothetical protein